ncbi:hypothetical protein LTR36_007273 [Oleoguttula mirabilis]|uniref:FAD-binding PCMH-type domain-containing protein n=1 Tax=Oleoguttula mirabilis TaxID=1507867 RepID=A0AAV9J9X9_9PEZI|nr:hypothetical protein LTR36_007273 [Oleoguttula mirabilis]
MAPTAEKRKVGEADVQKLRQLLEGTDASVLTPSDAGYSASIERWSRAAEKPSGVSIVPTSAEQVAVAIKYASEQNLDVAVKGGGHSTAGASSTNGGLLIDLGRMRKVNVDTDKQLFHVQGGCLWGDVDEAGWKHGLATVGGTVADTGVGGLTLGGGYGMLSGQRGLVIDNVVGATVVIANGDIEKASKKENADLFWALLGAGQNYGVTTEFVLQAYPQSDVYMGSMVFLPTLENVTKLVKAVNELYHIPEGGVSKSRGRGMGLLGLAKPPEAGGKSVILFFASHDGPEDEGKALFKPFSDIGPIVNTMAAGPYPQVNKMVPSMIGMRSSMKGAAFVLPIREQFVSDMLEKYESFSVQCDDAAASLVAWELYDPTKVVASEEGSFANRGFHLNSLIMPTWTKAENDQQCRQWARDMSLMFQHELETHGEATSDGIEGGASIRGHKGAVMLYGNYDQYDEKSKDIFGTNYHRLQQLKAKYDPTNVFNKLFPITPEAASNGHL